MSDILSRDALSGLWNEILKRHWTFLETEESIQKLEERKKLEGCLKRILCIVPHDRKFFLPETAHVLRKSIREMDDFTAYKAIIGFESISQYANNLFTKPWRKEFRILKMYSGFFQHEIKSNLIDAEKLFEAMGYRRLCDEVLILDGPICPDQVTNVSRDAMAAYVECQIMKNIYAGLVAMGLTCSWQDVYQYREQHVGGSTQAIEDLAYDFHERRLREEKLLSEENCYAKIQPPTSTSAVSQCPNCAPYHHLPQGHHHMQSNGQCAIHSSNNCALHSGVTSPQQSNYIHNNGINGNGGGSSGINGKLIASYPAASYQQHNFIAPSVQQPYMLHSRSLEHYNYNNEAPASMHPHRHSFDHQQQGCTAAHHYQQHPTHTLGQNLFESPYDCQDGVSMGGSSSVSYAAVAAAGGGGSGAGGNCNVSNPAYTHPYNVSGNRYPLPFNISNQLNSHYATPNTVNSIGSKGTNDMCSSNAENAYATVSKSHNCNYHQQPPLPPTRHSSAVSNSGFSKDHHVYRQQRLCLPALPTTMSDHQLIDFDDRAPLASHDFHAQQHRSQNNYSDYVDDRMVYNQQQRHEQRNRVDMNAMYEQPKDDISYYGQQFASGQQLTSSDDMYGSYMYLRPMPRGSKAKIDAAALAAASNYTTDKYLRNSEIVQDCVDNNRKMQMELKDPSSLAVVNGGGSRRKLSSTTQQTNERDASDVSYESFDDFVTVGHSEYPYQLNVQRSPTQATKNQDGVGSFESWNYVFQNLERTGYSKDLGERGDLLESLDLDSLNLANGKTTDKKRGTTETKVAPAAAASMGNGTGGGVGGGSSGSRVNGDKSRTLEKVSTAQEQIEMGGGVGGVGTKREVTATKSNVIRKEKSILKQQISNAAGSNSKKTAKSVLKSTNTTTAAATAAATAAQKTTAYNNNNGYTSNGGAVANTAELNARTNARRQQQSTAASSTTLRSGKGSSKQQGTTMSTNSSSSKNASEWSCHFCTFLNPDTKRICEMCCRSKDFNLEATISHTPTCV